MVWTSSNSGRKSSGFFYFRYKIITAHDIIENIVFRIFISQVCVKVTDEYDFLIFQVFTFKVMLHFVGKVSN